MSQIDPHAALVLPTDLCDCGHSRGEHETIERQWCAGCGIGGSRQREAWHLFAKIGQQGVQS